MIYVMKNRGDNHVEVVKAIRSHTGLGLRESSDASKTPDLVLNDLVRPEALEAFVEDIVYKGAVVVMAE